MAAPVLTGVVGGKLRPNDSIHVASLSWNSTSDTLYTDVQRQRLSGGWEDIARINRNLPQAFSEYVDDGVVVYRIVQARRVAEDNISQNISNIIFLTVGTGVLVGAPIDPVLGPPYPPVSFQLNETHDTGGVHFTWNVPDVFITGTAAVISPQILEVRVTNYDSVPGGTVLYIHARKLNKFGAVENIGADRIARDPADTQITPAFVLLNSSNDDGAGDYFSNPVPLWQFNFYSEFNFDSDLNPDGTMEFYVTAIAGGVKLSSQIISLPIHVIA